LIEEPGALGAALGALEVHVDDVRCYSGAFVLDDYPGTRPLSFVLLQGRGEKGYGEHVGFTYHEHEVFAAAAPSLVAGAGPVRSRVRPEASPFERAALEGALIDLALKQAGLTLGELCGMEEAPLRTVRSFSARADPAAHLRALRAQGDGEFKIDVDPTWSEETLAALAVEPGVVILDCKERGTAALAEALAARFPRALLEDPPEGRSGTGVARDKPLLRVADVEAAADRGEAVNLKAPRMGGVLAVLEGMQAARARGALFYLGGMFEVGPARHQARQLAALFCRKAPNDLAPLSGREESMVRFEPSSWSFGFG
jgi:L-alanine-DL-glutamate epimerase-like enolase superfamily enzyme